MIDIMLERTEEDGDWPAQGVRIIFVCGAPCHTAPPSLPIISITTITASRVYVSEASSIAATETQAATAAAAAAPVVSATTTTNRRDADDDDDDHPVANQ